VVIALTVADKLGTTYNFLGGDVLPNGNALLDYYLPNSIADRNGNVVTVSGTNSGAVTLTDPAGRNVISTDGFGLSGTTNHITTLSGTYQVIWKTASGTNTVIPSQLVYADPNGGCSAPPGLAGGGVVISTIALPNGQQYKFYYGSDNPDPNFNNPFGLLSEIDYPSGAWVKYKWKLNDTMSELADTASTSGAGGLIQDACIYLYKTPVVAQRTVGFGGSSTPNLTQTFSYTTNWASNNLSWTSKTATVTTTDNVLGTAHTNYTYSPANVRPQPYSDAYINPNIPLQVTFGESQAQYNDWNSTTILRTVSKLWGEFTLLCEVDQMGSSGPISGAFHSYLSSSQLTDKKEYDFGQLTLSSCQGAAPANPTRETTINYQTFTGRSGLPFYEPSAVITTANSASVAETDYSYDQVGVALVSPSPTGHDETNYPPSYNVRGNATTKTVKCLYGCSINPVTTYIYDETGQLLSSTDPCGNGTCADMTGTTHTTTYSYADSYTTLSSGQNINYSSTGNTNAYLTKVTDALGHVSTFKYDFFNGQLTQSTDPNSQSTSYIYNDPFNRPTMANFPDGGKTTTSYNDTPPNPSVTSSRLVNSSGSSVTSTSTMDGIGHLVKTLLTTDLDCASGDRTDTTYDGLGRVYTVSNPYCTTGDSTYGITSFVRDALGRTTLVTQSDGSKISTSYSGNCTTVTDEATKSRKSCFDGLGRVTGVWEVPSGANYQTSYAYDPLNNLTSVVQNGSHNRRFAYDSLSRLTTATNPESGTITYTYDLSGNLDGKTAPAPNQTGTASVSTAYGYDALNRLIWKTYSDSTPAAQYIYDSTTINGISVPNSIGRLTGENVSRNGVFLDGSLYYGYDPMGRPTLYFQCVLNCTTSGWEMSYAYDLLGNVSSYTNGLGVTFNQTFNTADRLSQITSSLADANHPGTLFSSAHYNASGVLTSATAGNGLTQTAAFDGRLQPCRRNVNSSGTLLKTCTDALPSGNVLDLRYGFNYGVSDNGNVASWIAAGAQTYSRTYTYDTLNRLASMSAPGSSCSGLAWSYDAWGNRTDQTVTGGSCTTFHQLADGNNRLVGYAYDAAGNMTNDGTHTFYYDAENRLIQVGGTLGTCSTATACYLYDAEGKRVQKSVGSAQTIYLHDVTGNVINELDATGATLANYIYANGGLLAEYKNATTHFVHQDHLGSSMLLTNMARGVSDCNAFYPFGEQDTSICTSTNAITHKFTGKERDSESGLDNFGARYDASSLGRFMTPDPLGGHQEDPQTLNKYAYVRNNPTTLTDPTGLDFNLNCDKNNGTTCQGGHQYYKDKDGNYQETVVKSDNGNLTDQSGNKYHGEVDGLGVHFSQDGSKTSSLGTWVNGSNETKFSQTSGALAGFSFDFHQTSKEQTANGTFYYPGAPRDAYDAVLNAGFSASMADDFFNPLHGYIGSYHYRSDGDPGTGKNSGHLIIRGVGILHPWDTVPTQGELHFGETNPNVNRIEHFRKDVF